MKHKQRMYKKKLKIIIILSSVAACMVALIITNIFVPVIYLTAYFHFTKDANPSGQLRVRYLNAGFGDCVLVELPDGKTMLIDGGTGTYNKVYNLLNVLNKSGINQIDYLFCTSVKSEHCGALAEIVKYKKISRAYIPFVTNLNLTDEYAAFYSGLTQSGAEVKTAQFGEGEYSPDCDYFFMILSPSAEGSPQCEYDAMNSLPNERNINNASVVLWLQYGGRAFMFLSDATAEAQARAADLIRLQDGKFTLDGTEVTFARCTAIKVANHCAEGYAEPKLFDVVQPEAAIITVGENAKACPSNTEIANIQLYVGNNLFRTDVHGAITVTVMDGEYQISKEKQR